MSEMASAIRTHRGVSPLIISVPHAGTLVPPEYRERMRPEALFLPDTDWFVDLLYQWAPEAGASLIVTSWSRYVIDLNRPPDNTPLYAEHAGSSLVPIQTFDGDEIYLEGQVPDQADVEERLENYWYPYHLQLKTLIESACRQHGFAILLDGHSIRSVVPGLFEGELPHLNLGTNGGSSASSALAQCVWDHLGNSDFTAVRDQRFKGGYITRHYGQPHNDVHALQLEIAQRAYMPESPPQWDKARASKLITLLEGLVEVVHGWKPEGSQ